MRNDTQHQIQREASNAEGLSRALDMVRTDLPSWKDIAAGGDRRRRWIVHWLWEIPLDGLQWLLFYVLGVLPISFVSNFGGLCARFLAPHIAPDAIIRTLVNLHWLEPTWSEARIRQVSMQHFESIGRLRAEFAVLHRLMRSGRISVENAEIAKATMRAGPVILVGCHIGNWEILGPVMADFGIPVFDIFESQPSRMQTHLALIVRAKCGPPGSVAYPRGANAPRAAIAWLKEGKPLIMFCDEAVNRISVAPFFGRPAHRNSNYAFAVRLAHLCDATFLPFHVIRHPGCRFTLHFGAPLKLAPKSSSSTRVLDDVVQLNAIIEPTIRANLGQWFWLNWGFNGVDYLARKP